MERYEEEALIQMFDKGFIGGHYKPIQIIRARINWDQISRTYGVNSHFARVLKHLANMGYVSDHGKSGDVASLTSMGVSFVIGKLREKREEGQSHIR